MHETRHYAIRDRQETTRLILWWLAPESRMVLGCVRMLGFAIICVLTACSSPPNLVGVGPSDTLLETDHRIFIATTRKEADQLSEFFSSGRAKKTNYATIDVSIPASHTAGSVELPSTSGPDPSKHFILHNPQYVSEQEAFLKRINQEIRRRGPGKRSAMIFIHGYNTNTTEAIARLAQLVEDSGYDGIPILFSWPSKRRTIDYVSDINSAAISRDELASLALLLNRSQLEQFDVVAHSMGNFVLMEAIRSLELRGEFDNLIKVSNIVLASPDIDVDLFETQMRFLKFGKSKFTVLLSQDDKALLFSRRIAGNQPRLGAADPEKLTSMGLTVIDLTQVDDKSTIHHSKFADSPQVVKIIGARLNAGDRLTSQASAADLTIKRTGDIIRVLTPG